MCVVEGMRRSEEEEEEGNSSYGYLWRKVMLKQKKARKRKRIEGCRRRRRRGIMGIKTRVRTLKSLIPNTHSMGLDGLFRQTAQYILCLQIRLRVMHIMLHAFSSSLHST